MTYQFAILFAVGLAATLASMPFSKWVARKTGAIDYPGGRRINKEPIPRTGGISMFLGLAASALALYVGTKCFGWNTVLIPHVSLKVEYHVLSLSVLAIFATGLVDDLRTLSPGKKLLGQAVAAAIAAASGLLINNIVLPFGGGEISLGWLAYPITVVYLVSFANIVNLIDGMDGLAGGITAIAAATMFTLSLFAGRDDAAALAIALVGVALGFLRYNFHPASVFMGDCGSNMLGFLLGVVALLSVSRTAALTTLIVPLIVAGVPIIDTFAAIIRRKRGHVSISSADTGHIQHRLMGRGYGQRKAALLIYGWSILLSAGAVAITFVEVEPRIAIFVGLLAISAVFIVKLRLFEPVLRHRYGDADGSQAQSEHAEEPVPCTDPIEDARDAADADSDGR